MEELAALGDVHPSRLADDTIELRPAPAPPELSRKVNEIFARACKLRRRSTAIKLRHAVAQGMGLK
jgi:hypothetical protein